MHLDTYTFTDTHILTDTHVFFCVLIQHTHPHVCCTHTCLPTFTHTHTHSQMCTQLHTITHIPPHPRYHTLIIISTCMHIHTHTHKPVMSWTTEQIQSSRCRPALSRTPLRFFPLLLRKQGTYGGPASCVPLPSFLRKMLPSQRAMGEAQDILGGEQP